MAFNYDPAFPAALRCALEHEGLWADHPDDPGGLTYRGMTLKAMVGVDRDKDGVLDFDLDKDGDVDADDLREIAERYDAGDPGPLEAFYRDGYWYPSKADKLDWPLSMAHFDAAVNHGPAAAALLLQRAAQVKVDGIVGRKTIWAVNHKPPRPLLRRLIAERLALYHRIAARRGDTFLMGWINRALDVYARSLEAL